MIKVSTKCFRHKFPLNLFSNPAKPIENKQIKIITAITCGILLFSGSSFLSLEKKKARKKIGNHQCCGVNLKLKATSITKIDPRIPPRIIQAILSRIKNTSVKHSSKAPLNKDPNPYKKEEERLIELKGGRGSALNQFFFDGLEKRFSGEFPMIHLIVRKLFYSICKIGDKGLLGGIYENFILKP